jgi:Mn2+/Fe2+ NRAMP family transporter
LLSYFLPFNVSIAIASAAILGAILFILLAGHFEALEGVAKAIMGVLVLATVAAFCAAVVNLEPRPPSFETPSPWTLATVGFLVVTMGWMPAPIEISSITSLWLRRQCQNQPVTPKNALFDFNLGYAVTTILALLFLGLGALVLHGSGETLATGGIGFSQQLVSLYANTIGDWAHWLIAVVAFLCIFGSALTVYDGYARVIAEAISLVLPKKMARDAVFVPVLLAMAAISFSIVLFFKSALLAMLGFAMTLAFVTTPMFAWLNHRLVKSASLHEDAKASWWVTLLSYVGLVYLFGFLLLFVWWKWG